MIAKINHREPKKMFRRLAAIYMSKRMFRRLSAIYTSINGASISKMLPGCRQLTEIVAQATGRIQIYLKNSGVHAHLLGWYLALEIYPSQVSNLPHSCHLETQPCKIYSAKVSKHRGYAKRSHQQPSTRCQAASEQSNNTRSRSRSKLRTKARSDGKSEMIPQLGCRWGR